jgi:hypothetical protein
MNGEELLVLKSHQIREINITSTRQIVKFKLSDESEIVIQMNAERRLEIMSTKLGQPLNIKPSAANVIEIFPELWENYFSVEKAPDVVLPKKITKTPVVDDEKAINEKCDVYGVTSSKMTMKKKPANQKRKSEKC